MKLKSIIIFSFLCFIIFGLFLFFKNTYKDNGEVVIVIKEGVNDFPNGINIDKKETLIIEPGAIVVMGEGTRINIKGKIVAKGTEEKPIIFKGKDDSFWRGIKINGSLASLNREKYEKLIKEKRLEDSNFFNEIAAGNIFVYSIFKNLQSDGRETVENRLKAAIEVSNAPIVVSRSNFINIVHIGCIMVTDSLALISDNSMDSYYVMKALHLVGSFSIVDNNNITTDRREYSLWTDGLYTKGGIAIVTNNFFQGFADGGVDHDMSLVYIINNNISDVYDDAIDIDNKSEACIVDNNLKRAKINGILVGNQSTATLINNKISETKYGLSIRDGASVVATDNTISMTKNGIRVFNKVPLVISESDYLFLKERFYNLSSEEIDYWGFYVLENGEDAVNLLEESYKRKGDVFYFTMPNIPHDLKNLFKVIDIFELEDVNDYFIADNKKELDKLNHFYSNLVIKGGVIDAEKDILLTPFSSISGFYFKKDGKMIELEEKTIINNDNNDIKTEEKNAIIKECQEMSLYVLNLSNKARLLVYDI